MREEIDLRRKLEIMMSRSREALSVAKKLHKEGHYNDSASRSYYAVFHSLKAVLLTLGLSFAKHSSVLSSFNKEFIHKMIFPKDFYRKIERIFRDRQIGDYGYNENISFDDSRQDIADAEIVIDAITEYLKKNCFLGTCLMIV